MGTIKERKRSDGSVAYSAQIVRTHKGKIVHRESRTFSDPTMADGWMGRREKELSKPGGIEAAKIGKETLGDAIDKYIATSQKKIGRTKAQVLETLKRMDIASKRCADIGSDQLVSLAEELIAGGRQPSTVGNYLSHLQAIFSVARPAWKMDLDPAVMKEAHKACRRLGLTGKSQERNRRPTLEELDKLMSHFGTVEERRNGSTPMQKIIVFALYSTRRQEEITRIMWKDLEPGRILVRDMKHPGDKKGNDTWCELVPEAERVIAVMPRKTIAIFPFTTDAISAAFTRACYITGINTESTPELERLTFHSLRHEGISRLIEMGRTIPQVASISGHRSWSSLQRYTHLRQTGDKYANWKWLEKVTKAP